MFTNFLWRNWQLKNYWVWLVLIILKYGLWFFQVGTTLFLLSFCSLHYWALLENPGAHIKRILGREVAPSTLEPSAEETSLGWGWQPHNGLEIFRLLNFGVTIILYSPLVFALWITFVRVIFILELWAAELISLPLLCLFIIDGALIIVRSIQVQDVLVHLEWLGCPLTEALVEAVEATWHFLLAGNVLLLGVVHFFDDGTLIDAFCLHVDLLHI